MGTVLTQARLKELLIYLPKQGLFVRRVSRGNVSAGSLAGGLNPEGYVYMTVDGSKYRAHRLAFLFMKGAMPIEVDHKNHVRNDNRWVNLRAACKVTNMRNQTLRADNTSGTVGVCWEKRTSKWKVQVRANGRKIHLGRFDNFEDAVAAREAANIKYNFHANHGNAKP